MRIRLTLLSVAMSAALWGQSPAGVEPGAGSWKPWVISSGKDFRSAPPPDARGTAEEAAWLKQYMAANGAAAASQIRYWDSGPATFRWMEWITQRNIAGNISPQVAARSWAYVSMAMYDATIAAWDSKYAYNRRRPNEADPTIVPAVNVPRSPSYPSDYAATAAAAAEVLAYLVPAQSENLKLMAEEAARSRLLAGVEYPSDYFAGLELGRKVAAAVIAKAQGDNFNTPYTVTVPTGPCMWVGTNPGNAAAVTWKPIVLTSPSEFRPPPPPSCTSPQMLQEIAAVRNFPRGPAAFATNSKAMYYQSSEGSNALFASLASRYLLEDHGEANPPRAARAYALLGVAIWDGHIASQDGKFTYWYLRPHMADPAIVPLFPVPNFPSYPSNHSTYSTSRAEVLAYLFPDRAEEIRAIGKEAGDSRIWAGIHYEIDNQAGVTLGMKVAAKIIDWAKQDGSQR